MLFHLAHTAIEILPVASPASQSLVRKQLYETQEEEEASEGTGVNFRNLHKMSAGDWERVGSGRLDLRYFQATHNNSISLSETTFL